MSSIIFNAELRGEHHEQVSKMLSNRKAIETLACSPPLLRPSEAWRRRSDRAAPAAAETAAVAA
jgi:hypothetical protein